MAQPTKMAASEKTYSQEEVIGMIRKSIQESLVGVENEGVEEILEKGVKDAFAKGLTVLAMIHGTHYMSQLPNKPSERTKTPTYQRIQEKMDAKNRGPAESISDADQIKQAGDDARADGQAIIDKYQDQGKNIDNFLKTISMNESSGGKNLNHQQMEGGLHAGDSAVGQYGLMPNTIKEMSKRMGSDHPLSAYSKMDNKSIAESIKKNPEHENEIGKFMANHLSDKFGGDENKMAYSWFQGHNLTDKHFETSHKDYLDHDYVKKFQKHKEQIQKTPTDESLASN